MKVFTKRLAACINKYIGKRKGQTMEKKRSDEANEKNMTGDEVTKDQLQDVAGGADDEQEYILHTVQSGETVNTVARLYRISPSSISRANRWLPRVNYLEPGWVLRIPVRK